jgi:hypothetical protein
MDVSEESDSIWDSAQSAKHIQRLGQVEQVGFSFHILSKRSPSFLRLRRGSFAVRPHTKRDNNVGLLHHEMTLNFKPSFFRATGDCSANGACIRVHVVACATPDRLDRQTFACGPISVQRVCKECRAVLSDTGCEFSFGLVLYIEQLEMGEWLIYFFHPVPSSPHLSSIPAFSNCPYSNVPNTIGRWMNTEILWGIGDFLCDCSSLAMSSSIFESICPIIGPFNRLTVIVYNGLGLSRAFPITPSHRLCFRGGVCSIIPSPPNSKTGSIYLDSSILSSKLRMGGDCIRYGVCRLR